MRTIRRYQRRLKHLNANLGHAAIRDPQSACSAERKVEDAVPNPRAAVADANTADLLGGGHGPYHGAADHLSLCTTTCSRIPFFGQETGAAVRSLRFVPPQEIGNLIMQSKRNLI